MREKGADRNDLLERFAADERLQLTDADIAALVAAPISFTGAATAQVAAFCDAVALVTARYPDAAFYRPATIL